MSTCLLLCVRLKEQHIFHRSGHPARAAPIPSRYILWQRTEKLRSRWRQVQRRRMRCNNLGFQFFFFFLSCKRQIDYQSGCTRPILTKLKLNNLRLKRAGIGNVLSEYNNLLKYLFFSDAFLVVFQCRPGGAKTYFKIRLTRSTPQVFEHL